MKLTMKAFNDDYYNQDVGIGLRGNKNHKRSKNSLLKRKIKRLLNKARRQDNKITCNSH